MIFPSRSWLPGSSELICCPALVHGMLCMPTFMPPDFVSFILNFPPLDGKIHVDMPMFVLGSTLSPFPVPSTVLGTE